MIFFSSLRAVFMTAFAVSIGFCEACYAMGSADVGNEMNVACSLPKATEFDGLDVCGIFLDVASQHYPEYNFVLGEDAELKLAVLALNSYRMNARVDWGEHQGEVLATFRSDAPLDEKAIIKFINFLLSETPKPY